MKPQPKGGMCATCRYKHNDCSGLDFHKMPVIEKPNIVKCTNWKRDIK